MFWLDATGAVSPPKLPEPTAKVVDMALAPDSEKVALALDDGSLRILDAASGKLEPSIPLAATPVAITWFNTRCSTCPQYERGERRYCLRNVAFRLILTPGSTSKRVALSL